MSLCNMHVCAKRLMIILRMCSGRKIKSGSLHTSNDWHGEGVHQSTLGSCLFALSCSSMCQDVRHHCHRPTIDMLFSHPDSTSLSVCQDSCGFKEENKGRGQRTGAMVLQT